MSLFDVLPSWQEDAACIPTRSGLPASFWDYAIDGDEPGERGETDAERVGRWQTALGVCLGDDNRPPCPVLEECLADARAGNGGGVRGGEVFHDQVACLYPEGLLPREHARREIIHGRPAGYRAHKRHGSDPCPPCRAAHNAATNASRAAGRGDPVR